VTRLIAVPDCSSVLTGHTDGRVDQWDLAKPMEEPKTLIASGVNKSPCTALAASKKKAAAGFADGRVALFDTTAKKELCPPWKVNDRMLAVNSLLLTPNPITLLSGSQDGDLRSWDIRGDAPRPTTARKDSVTVGATVTRTAISPLANFVAVGTIGSGVKLYVMNPTSKELISEFPGVESITSGTVAALAVSRPLAVGQNGMRSAFVLAAFSNQTVALYTVTQRDDADAWAFEVNPTQIQQAAQYTDPTPNKLPIVSHPFNVLNNLQVTAAAFSDDTSRMIVGTSDGKALVWELGDGGLTKAPLVLKGPGYEPTSSMTAVKVTADNKYAFTATADGWVRRWDLATFEESAIKKRIAELVDKSDEELLKGVGMATYIPMMTDENLISPTR
jgi:hypothetical protein